jgi:gliding motility-associated-like protein
VATTNPGTSVSGNVLSNDFDPDGNPLRVNVTPIGGPRHGTVVINPDGSFTYVPTPGYVGQDTFYYTVCDNANNCVTRPVVITVQVDRNGSGNDSPVANDDATGTTVNTATNGNLATNDSDPNGSPLTFRGGSTPSHGTVVVNPNGTYTYTPDPNYVGSDQFTYVVCDNAGLCDTATVYVVVGNRAPVTNPDINTNLPGETVSGNVLTNDNLPNGTATVTLSPTARPTCGTVTITPSGVYTYVPTPGTTCPRDSFQYIVCNSSGQCSTQWVYVNTVSPNGNRPPVSQNDHGTTNEGSPVSGNVLSNDFDPDGDELRVNTNPTRNPSHGTVVINADGSFTYTPTAGYVGQDTFWYTVCDRYGNCTSRPVILSVVVDPNGAANDVPYANDDVAAGDINTTISGRLGANDSDPNGDPLTFSVGTKPTHGTVVINSDGTYTYTPDPGFIGNDQFTYVVCDNQGACRTATVYVVTMPAYNSELQPSQGISPNGDDMNDVWVIPNIKKYQHKVNVYNRWGNIVFHTEKYDEQDEQNSFRGQWNNTNLPDGTYFYTIELPQTGEIKKGFIEVIR